MAALEFTEQKLYCGRYKELLVSIYELDADNVASPVAITAEDVIYAKLAETQGQATPALDINSETPLTGGSVVEIVSLGDVGNPDPDDDEPAQVKVIFDEDDTATLADGWAAGLQEKRYWLDLAIDDAADGHLKMFGRGPVKVFRSPGGGGIDP